jgi:hypothetical protein
MVTGYMRKYSNIIMFWGLLWFLIMFYITLNTLKNCVVGNFLSLLLDFMKFY